MGMSCSKICNKISSKQFLQEESEVEMQFSNYRSTLDGVFKKIENNYNLLQYLQLHEFVMLLTNYKVVTEDSSTRSYNQEINKQDFIILLENKIFKNYLISSVIYEGDASMANADIFKSYLIELFDSLIAAKIDRIKKKTPGVKIKKGSIKTIKKLFLFPIAIFFCNATDKTKVEFLSNLFVDNENKFSITEDLEDFLYYLFITQSTCALISIKTIDEKYPNKLDIGNQEFLNNADAFEVSDVERLKTLFINDFFKGKTILNKTEFEAKFANRIEDFGWIFNPSGVRFFLENHNNVKVDPDNN